MPLLGDLIVKFTSLGMDAVKGVMDKINTQVEQFQKGMEAAGRVATYAFAGASASMLGFVRAGTSGTVMGAALAAQMERLNFQIAGLFVPEMHKVIDLVSRAANFFTSLTDAQKENVKHWVLGAGAALGVAAVLPRLVSMLQLTSVVSGITSIAMKLLTLNFSALSASMGGLIPLIGMAATVFAGLAVGSKVGRDGLGGLASAIQPIIDLFKKIGQALAPVVDKVTEVLADLVDQAAAAIGPLLPTITEVFQGIVAAVTPIFGALGEDFKSVMPGVQTVLGAFRDLAKSMVGPLAMIAKAVGDLLTAIAPTFKAIVDAVAGLVARVTPFISMFADLFADLVKELAPVLGEILKVVGGLAAQLAGALGDLLKQIMPHVRQFADLFKNVLATMAPHWTKLITTVGEFVSKLVGVFSGTAQKLMPAVTRIVGVITTMAQKWTELFDKIWQQVNPLVEDLLNMIVDLWDKASPYIVEFADLIADSMEKLLPTFNELLLAVGEAVKALLPLFKDMAAMYFEAEKELIPLIAAIGKFTVMAMVKQLEIVIGALAKAVKMFAQFWEWQHKILGLAGLGAKPGSGGKDKDTDYHGAGGDFGPEEPANKPKEKKPEKAKEEAPSHDNAFARVGTESITATLSRLQQASLKVDWPQKTAENTKKTADNTDSIDKTLKQMAAMGPVFGV